MHLGLDGHFVGPARRPAGHATATCSCARFRARQAADRRRHLSPARAQAGARIAIDHGAPASSSTRRSRHRAARADHGRSDDEPAAARQPVRAGAVALLRPDGGRADAATRSRATPICRPATPICFSGSAVVTLATAAVPPRGASRVAYAASTDGRAPARPDSRAPRDRPPARRSDANWRDPPLPHEDEALADLAQDLEVERLVRMHAQEHHVALLAQRAEEIEHEADVAVLRPRTAARRRGARAARRGARAPSGTRACACGTSAPGRTGGSGWRGGRARVAHARGCRWPSTSTRPDVGALLPVMSSKSVVLPEPLGPSTPTIAGARRVKSASSVKVGVRARQPARSSA